MSGWNAAFLGVQPGVNRQDGPATDGIAGTRDFYPGGGGYPTPPGAFKGLFPSGPHPSDSGSLWGTEDRESTDVDTFLDQHGPQPTSPGTLWGAHPTGREAPWGHAGGTSFLKGLAGLLGLGGAGDYYQEDRWRTQPAQPGPGAPLPPTNTVPPAAIRGAGDYMGQQEGRWVPPTAIQGPGDFYNAPSGQRPPDAGIRGATDYIDQQEGPMVPPGAVRGLGYAPWDPALQHALHVNPPPGARGFGFVADDPAYSRERHVNPPGNSIRDGWVDERLPPSSDPTNSLQGWSQVPAIRPPATAIQGVSYSKTGFQPQDGWSGHGQQEIALRGLVGRLAGFLGIENPNIEPAPVPTLVHYRTALPVLGAAGTDPGQVAPASPPPTPVDTTPAPTGWVPTPIDNPIRSSYWDAEQKGWQPNFAAPDNKPFTERTFSGLAYVRNDPALSQERHLDPGPGIRNGWKDNSIPPYSIWGGVGFVADDPAYSRERHVNPGDGSIRDGWTAEQLPPSSDPTHSIRGLGYGGWLPRTDRGLEDHSFRGLGKLGSLGQWYNPVSWVQAGYNAVSNANTAFNDVQSIYNELQNVGNTVDADLTVLKTDLDNANAWLEGLVGAFQNYRADFLALIGNLTSYLVAAGGEIENMGYNIEATAKSVVGMLGTLNQLINTVVSEIEGLGNTLIATKALDTAQWANYLQLFSANMAALETTQSSIATDTQMMRSHFDNYSSFIEQQLSAIEQEVSTLPDAQLTSLSTFKVPGIPGLSGLGRFLGLGYIPNVSDTNAGGDMGAGAPGPSVSVTEQAVQNQKVIASGGTPQAIVAPPGSSAADQAFVSNYNQRVAASQALNNSADGVGPNVAAAGNPGSLISSAKALAPAAGSAISSSIGPYQQGSFPYSATGMAAVAKAIRLMAQTGVVATQIGNTVNSLATLHFTTMPQLLQTQQQQIAALTAIHNALQTQNSLMAGSLPSSTPVATSGNGSVRGVRFAGDHGLGEAVYVVAAG